MSRENPNIERLLARFTGKKADRTPNFEEIISKTQVEAILKKEVAGCTRSITPDEYVELALAIGMDAIVYYPHSGSGGEIFKKAGETSEQEKYFVTGSIKGWDDLDVIVAPDYHDNLEKLSDYKNATIGTDIGVCAWVCGPFTKCCLNMGYEDFLLKTYDDFEFVKMLMAIHMETLFNQVEVLLSVNDGVSFVTIGDDFADNMGIMLNPKQLEEIYFPEIKRLIQFIKSKGIAVMFHCCGNLGNVIPYFISMGVDAVHPLQSNVNDIFDLEKKFGQEICFVGNIGVTYPLAKGTPKDVRDDVRYHLENLASSPGGYVLCSDHSISDAVPVENFLVMVDEAFTFDM